MSRFIASRQLEWFGRAVCAGSLLRALLAVTVLLSLAPRTLAADKDPQIASVRVGFTGAPVEERWFPLRVSIIPGDEAIQAVLTVDVQQDSTQRATYVTPVAIAPGQTSVVSVPICMARGTQEISLTLTTLRGSVLHRRTLERYPADNADKLPDVLPPETPIIAALAGVHAPTEAAVFAAFPQVLGTSPSGRPGQELIVDQTLTPAELPDAWIAYQGCSVLMVRGTDAVRLDPRQLSAVRQWVLWGGRLIIIADAPGSEWQRWLPPSGAGMLTLAEASRDEDFPKALTNYTTGGPSQFFKGAQRRFISLSPSGIAAGWTLAADRDARGLMAVGPVGFGLVTVLGFDPAVAILPGSTAALSEMWVEIFALPTNGWSWMGVRHQSGYTAVGSGDNTRTQQALRDAMDATVIVPPVSGSLVLTLGIILLVLALILGPGDRFLLGKLGLRHRSWISGPLWIGVGALAMLIIPDLARSSQTTVSRLCAIDILCAPVGESSPTPAPDLAFTADLRAAFAAQSMNVTWNDLPPSGFLRGVSVTGRSMRDGPIRRTSASPLTLIARGAEGGGDDPHGGFSPADSGSASVMLPPGFETDLRRWSLRAVLAQARITTPVTAVALDTGSGHVIRVTGLTAEDDVVGTAMVTAHGRFAPTTTRAQDGSLQVPVPDRPSTALSSPWWNLTGSIQRELPDALDNFPGLPAREGATNQRLSSGRFVQVFVVVHHTSPAPAMTGAEQTSHFTLYRLTVPTPPGWVADSGPAEPGS